MAMSALFSFLFDNIINQNLYLSAADHALFLRCQHGDFGAAADVCSPAPDQLGRNGKGTLPDGHGKAQVGSMLAYRRGDMAAAQRDKALPGIKMRTYAVPSASKLRSAGLPARTSARIS